MKHNIELNCPDDRKFLNYWDAISGNDVVCEIIDGKLLLEKEEITLAKFIELVEQSSQLAEEKLDAIHARRVVDKPDKKDKKRKKKRKRKS